ncbi:hypothetical protein D9Q98_001422 [Chlorella vulgaris]|uniref:Uncharacterized protein n=1 Tax=Chlorella vulgaris TaxID=3077 RepID=A0A9D4U027_CHLVU|nr:hypothetical protein D9Q98_001422 [Chlorella vulgaris]
MCRRRIVISNRDVGATWCAQVALEGIVRTLASIAAILGCTRPSQAPTRPARFPPGRPSRAALVVLCSLDPHEGPHSPNPRPLLRFQDPASATDSALPWIQGVFTQPPTASG